MTWERLKDPLLRQRLKTRSRIIALVREFFAKEGFLEVETPIVVPFAGQEPYLNPIKTEVWDESGRRVPGYLITSPEYAHKKFLAAGFEKTFEITRAFRAGEQWGGLHNPEFTMIEWYRGNADYRAIMEDVEKMVQYVAAHISPEQAKRVEGPWERLTVAEAFRRYANVNLDEIPDDESFFKIFLTEIEPKLGFPRPTILYDYPATMASLARLVAKPQGRSGLATKQYAERFEVYIAGIELANAFSELTDAAEQRRRFLEEQKLRKKLGKELIPFDEDFLDAVGHMPPSAGIAFGVDRLVMLLTNTASIEEVLAFPAGELFCIG